MSAAPPALVLRGIAKRLGEVQALRDASLVVRPGSVHGLLGENGAGKTTLVRIAFGMESPDAGAMEVDGTPVRLASPAEAIAIGIGMVHQHFTLVPAMTVAENVALGGTGRYDPAAARERVRALGRTTGFRLDPDVRVRDLSVSQQQRLELLKALARDARVLILDEPTAVLAPSESQELLRQLRRLAAEGRAVVLITHKLREVLRVADDITVLRRGVTTLANRRSDIHEAELVEAMLGETQAHSAEARHPPPAGRVVISSRGVSVADDRGVMRVRDASFDVRAGEIVGMAAVEGSGQRELLRALAHRLPSASGTLELPDIVGFVPDDRHREGLVLDMSLSENFALRGAGARRGRMRWREVAAATRTVIREFDVRTPGERALAGVLSGGNQQKFIIGRELEGPPPALVIENPTRGLDVRASSYVRARLRRARDDGVAVLVYSADLDEIIDLADRMLVVFEGVVHEVPVDHAAVGRAMLGTA